MAVEAASNALPLWSSWTVSRRAEIVRNAANILIDLYGEEGEETPLKRLISHEVGKRLPEADIEVIESSDIMGYYSENAVRLLAPKEPALNQKLWASKRSMIEYEPVGVVGIIKAWNYPLETPIWSLAPSLIAGNTVVFKPSEHSSFVGIEIGKIFEKAGIPKGVLNIVTGKKETGKHLARHGKVNLIDFTGSVETGRKIAISCSASLKKYRLELGGNDAAIVCRDADLELTSNGLVWGAFCNSGQVCVGIKRAFVDKTIFDTIVELIVNKTKSLVPTKDYGPLISEEQLVAVEGFVADALDKGAKILTGGKRLESQSGYYYPPTVLTGITADMRLMNEECFGPLLPIISVNNTEEAIILTNKSTYGLGASIWTSNKKNGVEVARRIQSGMVWINDVNVAFPETPWGGVKNSGVGFALSDQAIYGYIEYKHISIEESRENKRTWWFPYS